MSVLDFEGLYCNLNYNQFDCREKPAKEVFAPMSGWCKGFFFTGQVFEAPPEKCLHIYRPENRKCATVFLNFFEKNFAWENTQLILEIE